MIVRPNFYHPWQYSIRSWWQEKVGCWPMDELIQHPQNIFSLIHKKCHPNTYHRNIMTLKSIFSVVQLQCFCVILLMCWLLNPSGSSHGWYAHLQHIKKNCLVWIHVSTWPQHPTQVNWGSVEVFGNLLHFPDCPIASGTLQFVDRSPMNPVEWRGKHSKQIPKQ